MDEKDTVKRIEVNEKNERNKKVRIKQKEGNEEKEGWNKGRKE